MSTNDPNAQTTSNAANVTPPPSSDAPDATTSTDQDVTSATDAAGESTSAAPLEHGPAEPTPVSDDFPTAGEGWDPTQQPPPDAAVGAERTWQEPTPGGEPTAPPASTDAQAITPMEEQHPGETISPSSFDVVAADGATERITPRYSDAPCPNCGNLTVETATVQAALPTNTLRGDTVNPGDQVVICASCGTTIGKGDVDQYEAQARSGAFGDTVKAALDDQAATLELENERQTIDRERQALEDRIAALDEREQRLAGEEERVTREQHSSVGADETGGGAS